MGDDRCERALAGRSFAIGAFFAVFLGACPALAQPSADAADRLALDYDTQGVTDCLSASQFQAAVVAKSGFDPFVPPGGVAKRRVVVRYHRDGQTLRASLEVPLEERVEERVLTSSVGDCGELSESAALVVSLLLEPPLAPPASTAPVAPPAPATPPVKPAPTSPPIAPPADGPAEGELAAIVFGRVWAGAGLLPGFEIGPALGGGVAIGPWEVRLELTWAPPTTTSLFDSVIETQRWMVDAMPCRRFTPWEIVSFTGCVSVHVGAIVYGARNEDGTELDGAQAMAGVGIRPGAQLNLNEMFAVAFELEALAQLPALEVGAVSRGAYLAGGYFAGRMLLGVDARFR